MSVPRRSLNSATGPIAVAIFAWALISIGFVGMRKLMRERPQFVGRPSGEAQAILVQESPRIVARKASDDVSVIQPMQPSASAVVFEMTGRRDYRGLRTIRDMSGEVRASYTLSNAFDEPLFVLFKSPHPRGENGERDALAGGLRLSASAPGIQENGARAWYWSGTLAPRSAATVEIAYQAGSLRGVAYRIGEETGNPVRNVRVEFAGTDLGAARFETRDGSWPAGQERVVWERHDFLAPDFFRGVIGETRSLYGSLLQLMEIGPLITFLFFAAALPALFARQAITSAQVLTLAAGYGLYFPLIVYLSSRFTFAAALAVAVIVPGALLLNYARWLLGPGPGLAGGAVALGLYQVFPTLAAFAGWNRGMVLLCLGVVTLAILIQLQNRALRQARRGPPVVAAAAAAWVALALVPQEAKAAEVQVLIPGEVAARVLGTQARPAAPLISFQPATYVARAVGGHFEVEATCALDVARVGEALLPVMPRAPHLIEAAVEPEDRIRVMIGAEGVGLLARGEGDARLELAYRVSIRRKDGRVEAEIPLLQGPPGRVRVPAEMGELEVVSGGELWGAPAEDGVGVHEIGVNGAERLILTWRDPAASGSDRRGAGPGGGEFYGIGISSAAHLTVAHTDGACAHFVEFELPAYHGDTFRMRLPEGARLISASVNGAEIAAPPVEDGVVRVTLPPGESPRAERRLSFRLAYPPARLGFIGSVEFVLPEVFQTVGILEWSVALPAGFATQVISSGLELQPGPAKLDRFGEYGRVVASQPVLRLAKNLSPPGRVALSLGYRQRAAGMFEGELDDGR